MVIHHDNGKDTILFLNHCTSK